MVADEIRDILSIEEERLNKEISRCRRVLDSGTDNVLQLSAGNTPTNSARSQASDLSDYSSSSSGAHRTSKSSKNRCLSCGDKLLTSESTIKVPGAVRIKISDPNIAFCPSCQLVYHLDDTQSMMRESQSQPTFKKIDCVRDHALTSSFRQAAIDDSFLAWKGKEKDTNKARRGYDHDTQRSNKFIGSSVEDRVEGKDDAPSRHR